MNLAFVPLLLMSLWATFGCHSRNSENDANSVGTENSISKKVSIEQVQSLVNQVLKSKSDNALLYSFEGFCLDVASQWIPEIMAAKIPANMQQTNAVHFFTIGKRTVMRSPTHYFIAFNPMTSDEIILDPTYSQFFTDAQKKGLPPVLVAKTSDIKNIYSKHADQLKLEVAYDENTGRYDPEVVAELIYSTGRFSKFRTSLPQVETSIQR